MYREWDPPDALRPWLTCVWVRDTAAAQDETVRVLPDACMDIMWVDGSLRVAGPDTGMNLDLRPAGGRIVGVRFHPGTAVPILGVDAADLTDRRVDLADLWGGAATRLSDRTNELPSVAGVARQLLRTVAEKAAAVPRPDPTVQAVVEACRDRARPLSVRELADALGISDRQLHRRSIAALGYGPKMLDRIMRFQRFLRCADQTPPGQLARVAAEVGYADQAHLTRDCQRLAGVPPTVLLATRAA